MGLMVVHGAQAGGFSPISIYGGITNKVVAKAGLPLDEIATMLASFGVNMAVALLLFVALGGMKLLRQRADLTGMVPATRRVAHAQGGPQVYGDAEGQALSEEHAIAEGGPDSLMRSQPSGTYGRAAPRLDQWATLAGLIALAVLTLFYKLDIGFVSLSIGLLLTLMSRPTCKSVRWARCRGRRSCSSSASAPTWA
jgi:hypothetical protein